MNLIHYFELFLVLLTYGLALGTGLIVIGIVWYVRNSSTMRRHSCMGKGCR